MERLLEDGEYARVRALSVSLPAGSRTVMRLEPATVWDEKAYLLALIADNIAFQRYEQAGGKGHKPKAVERPKPKKKQKEKRRLDVSQSQVRSMLFAPRGKV